MKDLSRLRAIYDETSVKELAKKFEELGKSAHNSIYFGRPVIHQEGEVRMKDSEEKALTARLNRNAERYQIIRECVRIGEHGEFVILPDDPHDDDATKRLLDEDLDRVIEQRTE